MDPLGFDHPFSLPSGYVNIAIEHGPVEIVDFPMKNGGSFQFAMLVITRGYHLVMTNTAMENHHF